MIARPNMLIGAAACAAAAGLAFAQPTTVALWDMDPAPGGGNFPTATEDLQTQFGEGTLFGAAPVLAAVDDLAVLNGLMDTYFTSGDVPPASMYNPANPFVVSGDLPSTASYDASAIAEVDGILLFPVDQFGAELAFEDSFTVEGFFKTDGDRIGAGRMQILAQSEGPFRYGVVLNESSPGGIRFGVRDDRPGEEPERFFLLDIDTQNFANGAWWYFKGEVDTVAGEMRLSVTGEDGLGETAQLDLPEDFTLADTFDDGVNAVFGRLRFPIGDPATRNFLGLIDDIQLTEGIVSMQDMVGVLPSGDLPDRGPQADVAPIARWSMDPVGLPGVILSVRDGVDGYDGRGENPLWTFSNIPTFDPPGDDTDAIFTAVEETAPDALYAPGEGGGTFSYDASAFADFDGAVVYDPNENGDVFSFEGGFTVEMVFRTDGDRSEAGLMQLLNQGEARFRYGLIVNEAGPGSLRFALNDDVGVFPIVDLTDRNYADGEWHYLVAQYDPAAGQNGQISLRAVSLEGGEPVVSVSVVDVPDDFAGLPEGGDGNLFIGRNTFGLGGEPRTFLGLIDEVRIGVGVLPDDRLIGAVGDAGVGADFNDDGVVDLLDLLDLLAGIDTGDQAADLNGDGAADFLDLIVYLGVFDAAV